MVRAARRARRRESRLRHAQEVQHSATKYPRIRILQARRVEALSEPKSRLTVRVRPPKLVVEERGARLARPPRRRRQLVGPGIKSAVVRRNSMDPRGVLSSGIERRFALRVSLMSIARLPAFIRLANMSSRSMMTVSSDGGFRLKAKLLASRESILK